MKITTLILMALFTPIAFSQVQLNDSLQLSGFGSFSLARTNQDTPIFTKRMINNDWCFDCDTILGAQLDLDFSPQLRSSIQVVKRPQDDFSEPELEWAFISYQFNDFSIKLGRLRLPLFMMSEYYYVSHAYPWIRPPQDVYESILGITHYDGLSFGWDHWMTDDMQLHLSPFVTVPHEQHYNAYGLQLSIKSHYTFGLSADIYYDDNAIRLAYLKSIYTQTLYQGDKTDEEIDMISLGWSQYFKGFNLLIETVFTKELHSNWYISVDKTWDNWTPYCQYSQQRRAASSESLLCGVKYSLLANLSVNMEFQHIYGRKSALNGHFTQIQKPEDGIENEVQLYTLGLSFTF